jgi:hypothetical protein
MLYLSDFCNAQIAEILLIINDKRSRYTFFKMIKVSLSVSEASEFLCSAT